MLVKLSYKTKQDSKQYQTSGTITIPIEAVPAAVLHLDANDFEVTAIVQAKEAQ